MNDMPLSVSIAGAGLSGLLTGVMLAGMRPQIFEKQEELPNNHHSVLRFRTPIVGEVLNVPFKKVTVIKGVHGARNPVSDAIAYATKVTGRATPRSVINTEVSERYIAPPDLVQQVGSRLDLDISYNTTLDFRAHADCVADGDTNMHAISTMPMPKLMEELGWEEQPTFHHIPGWTVRARLRPRLCAEIYATLYAPYDEPWYRASITGDELILEGVGPTLSPAEVVDAINSAIVWLGFSSGLWAVVDPETVSTHTSPYQKLAPLSWGDQQKAKRFVMWATDKYNIYSVGRFALWRPGLLLDDVVKDVRIVRRLIEGGFHYDHNRRG